MTGHPSADALRRRITRWQATLDTDDMWPETTAPARQRAYHQILRATEAILAGRPGALDGSDELEVRALGVAGFVSGMGALLGLWIEQDRLTAPDGVARLFADHLAHSRRRVGRTTEQLRQILSILAHRGVTPAFLKGTYTARRYFADPASRPASDADLLVSPAQFEAARAGLRELGWERYTAHTSPHREEWGPAGDRSIRSVDLAHEANPWSIDLHCTLDRTYFPGLVAGLGSPDPAGLSPWPSPFGRALVLPQPLLAAHLAIHAGCDLPDVQLIRIVELVQVLRQDAASRELDWSALRDLFGRTGTRRFAYPGMELAALLAPDSVDPALRADLAADATPRMRRAVALCARVLPFHFRSRSVDLQLVWAKGPRQVTRKLLDLAYPTGPATTPVERLKIWQRRLGFLVQGRVGWNPAPADQQSEGPRRDA